MPAASIFAASYSTVITLSSRFKSDLATPFVKAKFFSIRSLHISQIAEVLIFTVSLGPASAKNGSINKNRIFFIALFFNYFQIHRASRALPFLRIGLFAFTLHWTRIFFFFTLFGSLLSGLRCGRKGPKHSHY